MFICITATEEEYAAIKKMGKAYTGEELDDVDIETPLVKIYSNEEDGRIAFDYNPDFVIKVMGLYTKYAEPVLSIGKHVISIVKTLTKTVMPEFKKDMDELKSYMSKMQLAA